MQFELTEVGFFSFICFGITHWKTKMLSCLSSFCFIPRLIQQDKNLFLIFRYLYVTRSSGWIAIRRIKLSLILELYKFNEKY